MEISVANKSGIITPSGFSNYDVCANPYVGCSFGCTYCYVRFFIKDKKHKWGDFVRVRKHAQEKLTKELSTGLVKTKTNQLQIPQARLVIGTMTDPYQPIERKERITRSMLQTLTNKQMPQFNKVGIFSRSPIICDDLDLITQLPQARVHFTVTPFPPEVLRAIEPGSPRIDRRWQVIKELKAAGLRVHCNISPIIPGLSEQYIKEFVHKVIELQVDEYFVDPMQPYKESFESFKNACEPLKNINWSEIEHTITNKKEYLEWKTNFFKAWNEERIKHQYKAPNQLPIWCDHERKIWINMLTMRQMDNKNY